MKEIIISVTAIICLTVLGVLTKVEAVVYTVVVTIAGFAGHYIPKAVTRIRKK